MKFLITPEAITAAVASSMALLVAIVSARKKSIGATSFTAMMCAVCVWALGSALDSAVIGIPGKLLFSVLAYAGTVNVAPLFFLFAVRYRRHAWKPSWWEIICLWTIPVLTMIFAATNGQHGLVWSRLTPSGDAGSNYVVFGRGPWYFVPVIYNAVLGLAAALVLGRAALRAQAVFIWQTAILLTGLLIPWIGTVIYLLPTGPFRGVDLPPISFAITGVLVLIGISRFHLMDVVPVARDRLVESMGDCVIVLDEQDRVVDLNPAARALFGGSVAMIGKHVNDSMSPLADALVGLRREEDEHREISLPGATGGYFDVRVSPLLDRGGEPSGCLLVVRDLTERRQLEMERERLIVELRTALADVKTLSGLLPICSSCKKIRNDKGYWENIEKYVAKHSQAQFSHGLCEDCARRLYPDLVDKKPDETAAG